LAGPANSTDPPGALECLDQPCLNQARQPVRPAGAAKQLHSAAWRSNRNVLSIQNLESVGLRHQNLSLGKASASIGRHWSADVISIHRCGAKTGNCCASAYDKSGKC